MILRLAIAVTLGLTRMAQADVAVTVAYLHVEQPLPPTLSNLDPLPDDLGLAGVRTGIADNATTGRFLGQTYALIDGHVAEGEDPLAAAKILLQDTKFLILNAAPEIILQIADLRCCSTYHRAMWRCVMTPAAPTCCMPSRPSQCAPMHWRRYWCKNAGRTLR